MAFWIEEHRITATLSSERKGESPGYISNIEVYFQGHATNRDGKNHTPSVEFRVPNEAAREKMREYLTAEGIAVAETGDRLHVTDESPPDLLELLAPRRTPPGP